jgi:hypothetical protein
LANERKGFFTETAIRNVIANLPDDLQDFTLFAYITGMRGAKSRACAGRMFTVMPSR